MNLSLSAGGTPDQTRQALRTQVDNQLGTIPDEEKAKVASAVLGYIERVFDFDAPTVSVSASMYISGAPSRATAGNATIVGAAGEPVTL